MPHIVAGLYEIEQEIGAGGGGVVYLGRHILINKTIVLKADKRRLSTDVNSLRREVDILKDLSQTYIPQVYDFVQEDGMVYTVMDYIDGESLDKLLARGELPKQAELVKWACQLLEALAYLHNSPPYGILHGDIKPANIMRRPSGDICLIDYNIALALGEEGAVKVGFSRGYASPEHYGADYIRDAKAGAGIKSAATQKTTESMQVSQSGVQSRAASIGSRLDDKTEVDDRTEVDDDRTKVDDDRTEVDERYAQSSGGRVESQALSGAFVKRSAINGGATDSATGSKGTTGNTTGGRSTAGSTTGSKSVVMLDVRSDIYSLGATLYHLICGRKPAQHAKDVVPLTDKDCSPAIAEIIKKAMSPKPEDRYQTAEEMLEAFLQLPYRDKRAVRHRRRIKVSAVVLGMVFLAGGALTFVGLKQMEQRQNAYALAEYSANALAEGNVTKAVNLALDAIPQDKSILNAPVTAQAQKALTDALGVYDLSDSFHALDALQIPSAPFDIVFSPEGKRFAVVYAFEVAVFDAENQNKLVSLPMQQSAFSYVVFVNEDRIVYAGAEGVTAYDINENRPLWTGGAATILTLSADGSTLAAVNRDEEKAIIYNVDSGVRIQEIDFAGRHLDVPANDIFADASNYIFSLDKTGNFLAVSFQNGALNIYDLKGPEGEMILFEESAYTHFEGGFCGNNFAFSGSGAEGAVLGIVDCKEAIYRGGYESVDPIYLEAGENGIYVVNENLLVRLDTVTFEEQELAYTDDHKIVAFSVGGDYSLVATDDSKFAFYDKGAHLSTVLTGTENADFVRLSHGIAIVANRNEPVLRMLKLEDHKETEFLSYDADYSHDEARISQDGQRAMLFDIRSYRIYSANGTLVTQADIPDPEHIYDQQFRRNNEGSYLEVIWYDGTVRCYSAWDGILLSEQKNAAPDKDLYEEFVTEQYRIQSSLHGAPEVYDLQTGKYLASLEEDAYLTYVTQVGDYLVTEYVGAAGDRYGILLNERFEKLAVLPELCDVREETLVFDYESGNLRQCRLYSLPELIALGETYK